MQVVFGVLAIIIALAGAYYLSLYGSAILILLVFNIGLTIGNFLIIIWYYLQNAWSYIIKGVSYLDYLVCILPVNPIIAWGILGAIIGSLIAFLVSVRSLRRSYKKPSLIFCGIVVLLVTVLFTESAGKRQAIEESSDVYFRNGEYYYNTKEYTQAIVNYTKWIQLHPNDSDAYFRRGKSHYDKAVNYEEYKVAVDDYKSAIDLDPKTADYHFHLAEAYCNGVYCKESSCYGLALLEYNEAMKLNTSKGYLLKRADCHERKGYKNRAEDDRRKAAKL